MFTRENNREKKEDQQQQQQSQQQPMCIYVCNNVFGTKYLTGLDRVDVRVRGPFLLGRY